MSKTYKDSQHDKHARGHGSRTRQRNISVRAIRREPPDLRRLGRAIIALAAAQAEADAEATAAADLLDKLDKDVASPDEPQHGG